MGLSIHYNGTIKDTRLVPQLVDELRDICNTLQWKYHLFEDEPANGICFSPENCETLFFTFSKSGELCSPLLLHYNIHPATTISVKTQYAGMDAHKAIIKLLKHIKLKYFSEFELYDEGGYWESDDENVLRQQFDKYEFILNAVWGALQDFQHKDRETPGSLADRLERFLRERLSNL